MAMRGHMNGLMSEPVQTSQGIGCRIPTVKPCPLYSHTQIVGTLTWQC